MKRIQFRKAVAALLLLCVLLALPALAELNLRGVRATPVEALAFRTGPSTAYGELYTLPESTPLVALELEDGNDVTWVLLEFEYQGSRVRAYTGLKRVSLSGSVPYADHTRLTRTLLTESSVHAAPDFYAEVRAVLPARTNVTFLGFEGAYCFIEYNDNGELNRGYVREEAFMVDLGAFAEGFPDNNGDTWYAISEYAPMYAGPYADGAVLFDIPFDASVTVMYDDFYTTPEGWLSLYYGGLHGYGRADDFSDLRFSSPEQARAILSELDF